MGWEDLYIVTALLGLGVVWAGARTLSGYTRSYLDSVAAPDTEPPLEASAQSGKPDTRESDPLHCLTVTLAESGRQFPWDQNAACLLEFIQSQGIEVDCLCRAGECGSCRTRVIEGEVAYLKAPKIDPGDGHCLLCVTLPRSDLVLDR